MQYSLVNTLMPKQNCRNFQTIYSNLLSWINIVILWVKLHWSVFLRANWQLVCIGLHNSLEPNRRHAIIWNSDGLDYWCMYTSRNLNDFSFCERIISETEKYMLILLSFIDTETRQADEMIPYGRQGLLLYKHDKYGIILHPGIPDIKKWTKKHEYFTLVTSEYLQSSSSGNECPTHDEWA